MAPAIIATKSKFGFIEKLIFSGQQLLALAQPYSFVVDRYYGLFKDYENWHDTAKKEFSDRGCLNLLPPSFSIGDNLQLPRLKVMTGYTRSDEDQRKIQEFVNGIAECLKVQIEILNNLQKELPEQDSHTILNLKGYRLFIKEVGEKYFHDFTESKRFKLVKLLIKAKGYYAGKKIIKEIGYPNIQTISNEKRKINKLIYKSLGLNDFIDEGKSGFGYRINQHYFVETIR